MTDATPLADDDWLIEDGDQPVSTAAGGDIKPWRVLIVDDEPDIHAVTRLVLGGVNFKGRSLELLSAYSAAQGYEMLATHPDIALVLLDVVMETDDAGLRLAQRIRTELGNNSVRIVLRTGQPGQAPEERVIVDFDINDYKAKTELTQKKLFTTVIASLRAYEGLVTIERNNLGLRKILQGASNLYQLKSLKEFASGVLNQIGAILDVGADGVLCVAQEPYTEQTPRPSIIAATGRYSALAELDFLPVNHEWSGIVTDALTQRHSVFVHPVDVLFAHASTGYDFAIVLTPPWPLEESQRNLLGVFCDRIAAAFDNLHMFSQLQKAQQATVIALADLAESRDPDTGGHVYRVCRLTDAICAQMQRRGLLPPDLPAHFLEQIGLASMLHDVGKVATPDAVLLKPGRHTPQEREIMEQHVTVGEKVLQRAAAMVEGATYLTIGAQIAAGHHEHFDGGGYPRQLKGDEIALSARIVAVVDVFDALLHRRPYKEPWPLPDVVAYLLERRGTQFDPDVLDALLAFLEADKPDWIVGGGH